MGSEMCIRDSPTIPNRMSELFHSFFSCCVFKPYPFSFPFPRRYKVHLPGVPVRLSRTVYPRSPRQIRTDITDTAMPAFNMGGK